MKLKIMSYNVQSGRNDENVAERSYDFCADVIASATPDIVGLNEIGRHAHGTSFPILDLGCEPYEYLGKKLSMHYAFAQAITTVDGCPYGNALLSKYPIISYKSVRIPDPVRTKEKGRYESRVILACELDVPGGLTVLVTHFGLEEEEKVSAVNTVLELLDEIKTPVVLMGDFNSLATDEHLLPLYDRLSDTADGESVPFTWPANVTKRDKPSRKIDYIFHSGSISSDGCYVIETLASDHLPLVTEIEL